MRTIYWSRALDVWREHELAGAGAGSFAQAQLRFRDQPTQGRHAHGYVHQTLADLGLIGLAVSLVALVAWLLAAARTLASAARRASAAWTPERTGLLALALVAVVFGVHSAIDWTWFVPAVAVTGLFCAGWVAGRGPIALDRRQAAAAEDGAAPAALRAAARACPCRPGCARGRRVALAVLAVDRGRAAVARGQRGRRGARAARRRATSPAPAPPRTARSDINPLSVEPYFERAAIEDAAGQPAGGARARSRTPCGSSPRAPRRGGGSASTTSATSDQPARAMPVLRAALFLDPTSPLNRRRLRRGAARAQARSARRR